MKRNKLGCVLSVALLASFLLASFALVAQAWWYTEWRVHESDFISCERRSFSCGYKWVTQMEQRKWRCNDILGYCYDTGKKRVETDVSDCQSDCPWQVYILGHCSNQCVGCIK
jgi:hypothetical protein